MVIYLDTIRKRRKSGIHTEADLIAE